MKSILLFLLIAAIGFSSCQSRSGRRSVKKVVSEQKINVETKQLDSLKVVLIADETYFVSSEDEYDFTIYTYNPSIARKLRNILHNKENRKVCDSAILYSFDYNGVWYNRVESLFVN